MTEREKLLKKVQIADFELVEANLYLDVYPYCNKGLGYFYATREKATRLRHEYEEKYGPLTANSTKGDSWNWIDSPWPWKCEG
jgi:spore coat protein JB